MERIKSIVIYDTCTGNTKRVANEIATGLKCQAVFVDNVNKDKLDDYNLVIIGTPVHAVRPTKKIKQFLDSIGKPEHGAFFCTYGVPLWGRKYAEGCLNYMEKKLNINCLGKFKCPGSHYILRTYKNHPNENDLINVRIFAKRIINSLL